MQVSCLLAYLINEGHAYNFENILLLSNSDSKNPQWYTNCSIRLAHWFWQSHLSNYLYSEAKYVGQCRKSRREMLQMKHKK